MIEIRNLSKRFGILTALREFNLSIERGETVALIGPPGSGKSTLLHCLSRLATPDRGEFLLGGIDLLSPSVSNRDVHCKVGLVQGGFELFPHRMLVENLMLGPRLVLGMSRSDAYREACRLLEENGLAEYANRYPSELSQGETARALIARALSTRPEFLLIDELTTGCDPLIADEIIAMLQTLSRQGVTMLGVTAHYRFLEQVSHRTLYMEEGIVLEGGPTTDLLTRPERAATRDFLHKLRSLVLTVTTRSFDHYRANAQIDNYAIRERLTPNQTEDLKFVVDELVIKKLLPRYADRRPDLEIVVSHDFNGLHVRFSGLGDSWNPFDETEDPVVRAIRERVADCKYASLNYSNSLILKLREG